MAGVRAKPKYEPGRGMPSYNYADGTYWDDRYKELRAKEEQGFTYDCYFPFERVWDYVQGFFDNPQGERVLLVGSGMSEVAKGLYNKGFRNITCVDLSAYAVAHMQFLDEKLEGVEYQVADIRCMEVFKDEQFSLIIDKGTIDCMFCSFRESDALLSLQECFRVLKPAGTFLLFSLSCPETRLPHLCHRSLTWDSVEAVNILGSGGDHMYVMCKRPEGVPPERSLFDGQKVIEKIIPRERVIPRISFHHDNGFRDTSAIKKKHIVGSLVRNCCRDADDVWNDIDPYSSRPATAMLEPDPSSQAITAPAEAALALAESKSEDHFPEPKDKSNEC